MIPQQMLVAAREGFRERLRDQPFGVEVALFGVAVEPALDHVAHLPRGHGGRETSLPGAEFLAGQDVRHPENVPGAHAALRRHVSRAVPMQIVARPKGILLARGRQHDPSDPSERNNRGQKCTEGQPQDCSPRDEIGIDER